MDAVDAFCENIAFTLEETGRLLEASRRVRLRAHVHAGQLSDMGAAELAARYGALSADHLEYLSEDGARALAPCCGHCGGALAGRLLHACGKPPRRRCRLLRAAGVPMAIRPTAIPETSPVHVAPAGAQHGLQPVRIDARGGGLRGRPALAARALGRDAAISAPSR